MEQFPGGELCLLQKIFHDNTILKHQLCSFCNFCKKIWIFQGECLPSVLGRVVNWYFYTCWNTARLVLCRKSLWYEDTSYFPPVWKCVLLWGKRWIPFLSPCLSGEQWARKAVEWLGEQAQAFPCVAVLTEPEGLDNGMMLSLRIPREWQEGERAHASLSSAWQTKPCSRARQQYLFLVRVTERNMICFYSISWIAVVKMTARTRADVSPCLPTVLSHPAAKWVWRRREILPCWVFYLLRVMGCTPLFPLRCLVGSRAQLLSRLFQTVTNLFPESTLFLI